MSDIGYVLNQKGDQKGHEAEMLCTTISFSEIEAGPHPGAARPIDVRFLYLEVTEMLWQIQGL